MKDCHCIIDAGHLIHRVDGCTLEHDPDRDQPERIDIDLICAECGHRRDNRDQARACCTMQGSPCPECQRDQQWIDQMADALTAHAIADVLTELDTDGIAAQLADVGLWPKRQPAPAPVREVRMVPVPTIPDTARWTAADRAHTARVLSYQLAELLSTYGSRTTLEALALAYRADMQPAADAIRAPRLAAAYQAAAAMLEGMAEQLDRAEADRG